MFCWSKENRRVTGFRLGFFKRKYITSYFKFIALNQAGKKLYSFKFNADDYDNKELIKKKIRRFHEKNNEGFIAAMQERIWDNTCKLLETHKDIPQSLIKKRESR